METASYFQPAVAFFTAAAIRAAFISGPEGILIGSLRPVTLTLMLVPPTSITRTFIHRPPTLSLPPQGEGKGCGMIGLRALRHPPVLRSFIDPPSYPPPRRGERPLVPVRL